MVNNIITLPGLLSLKKEIEAISTSTEGLDAEGVEKSNVDQINQIIQSLETTNSSIANCSSRLNSFDEISKMNGSADEQAIKALKETMTHIKNVWNRFYTACQKRQIHLLKNRLESIQSNITHTIEPIEQLCSYLKVLSINCLLSPEEKNDLVNILKQANDILSAMKNFPNDCQSLYELILNDQIDEAKTRFQSFHQISQERIFKNIMGCSDKKTTLTPDMLNSLFRVFGFKQIMRKLLQISSPNQASQQRELSLENPTLPDYLTILETLPDEILMKIIFYLSTEDLRRLSSVSKTLRHRSDHFFYLTGVETKEAHLNFITKLTNKIARDLYTVKKICDFKGRAFCVEGNFLFFAENKQIKIWNLNSNSCIATLTEHDHQVSTLHFKDGRLFSGSDNGIIKAWDVKEKKCLATLKGHTGMVRTLCAQENILASGADDATIRIWDLSTSTCTAILRQEAQITSSLQSNEDSLFSVGGAWNGTITRWNLKDNQSHHHLTEHNLSISCIYLKGNKLVFGFHNGVIEIWDITTNSYVAILKAHESRVSCIQLEGNLLFTRGWDNRISILSLDNGSIKNITSLIDIPNSNESSPNVFYKLGNTFFIDTENSIKMFDFNTPFSRLLQAAEAILNGNLEPFTSFSSECQNAVFKEFNENDDLNSVKQVFLRQSEEISCREKKAGAIYRVVLKEVQSLLKENLQREALSLFKKLPPQFKNAIYKQLYQIITFQNDYFGCAEDAFLGLNEQETTDKKRIEAIDNFFIEQRLKRYA